MNNYQKWFQTVLVLILLPVFLVGGFNYYIDPLWTFNHAHQYNRIQLSFNERQQKTNRLAFGKNDYDSLLLGSSRVTYINQHDFTGQRTFNYAVNNMLPQEYADYARFARQQNGRDFDTIYLGLDFFSTNRNLELPNQFEPPAYYIDQTRQFGYRFKNLLSTDLLKYSWKNLENSRRGEPVSFSYDHSNVKTLVPAPAQEKAWRIAQNMDWYGNEVYGGNYRYGSIKPALQQLKAAFPHTRFVVFTTPVSEELFQLMVDEGRWPDYQHWLTEIVEVFGEVCNFNYPNTITRDMANYYDASHFYPRIGTLIAHRISGVADPALPDDFGVRVTRTNLPAHLRAVD